MCIYICPYTFRVYIFLYASLRTISLVSSLLDQTFLLSLFLARIYLQALNLFIEDCLKY